MSNTYPPTPDLTPGSASSPNGILPPLGVDPTSTAYPTGGTTGGATGGSGGASGKAGAAKEQAADLGGSAKDATKEVAGTAKEQAGKVASEAKGQAKQLISQTRSELSEQATTQQARVASGLKSLSDELSGMAGGAESKGVASDVVGMAAERVGDIASWLDGRDPGSLLGEVRQFAAQRPGTFILGAAVAGLLVGRLTRSLAGVASDEKEEAEASSTETGYAAPNPFAPPTTGPAFGAGGSESVL
ncbi:hypothetical protein [Naasia lichenicola]|uniref:DUF3618 domain-containing protein n=1 Tax=Naasia lichenicola TaxID=2565933 RepID=A0A4S4FIS5_9MICO|nr:hypothetical protein [Naasia lichenicola]THG30001.1 hypothetical protein E6C64_15275 [Naasia lichenicola]